VLATWITTLSAWGYSSVRTSALAPSAATAFADIGFTVAQQLSLLERQHSSHPTVSTPTTNAISTVRLAPYSRAIKKSVRREVLALDVAAFGEQWSMDEQTLSEALRATRRARLFVWKSDGLIEGFVLVGATGRQGFVQRLAVHPDVQRTGIATQLLEASLAWTQRRGCTATVVNTEVSNSAALGAYHRFGFTPLDYGLSVLEMQIPQ
jgi:ribosomal protein S18 acetylase RimI-like enzyme